MPKLIRNSFGHFVGRLAGDLGYRSIMAETKHPEKHKCDGLDNRKKLQEIVTNQRFDQTTFAFFGGELDPLMAVDPMNPSLLDRHFATDLYTTAQKQKAGEKQKFVHKLFFGDHLATLGDQEQKEQSELLWPADKPKKGPQEAL